MASEATSLGLEVNWQKTKFQALGSREDEPSTITVQGQEVAVDEELIVTGEDYDKHALQCKEETVSNQMLQMDTLV